VADGFQVVAPGLLVPNVGVDRGVTRSACQVLAFAERNMLALRVLVALGKSKVDDVDVVLGALGATN